VRIDVIIEKVDTYVICERINCTDTTIMMMLITEIIIIIIIIIINFIDVNVNNYIGFKML
jgi:hypothetical protein